MRIETMPTKKQQDFLDWEMGAFFHFGIRTFYEGHKDWDLDAMPLEGFNPTALDCENWIDTIKKAGFNYAILVCKHHDGFANWPSEFTEYSVKNTAWKDGKGDVVREFTDACHKMDIKVGLYYSPAEFGSKSKGTKEYDDYFINQISELLSNYGKIDYLWFDGCGSEDHKYDTDRIVAAIRNLQPEILLFNMWDPDTRWAGNESGLAHMKTLNVVDSLDFSVQCELKDKLETSRFLPVECDCRLRRANWFYSDFDEDTIKTVDELMGLYNYSVGRGANLLLNISPNRQGLISPKDAQRVDEFSQALKEFFAHPVAGKVSKTECGFTLLFEEPVLINKVVLAEDLMNEYITTKFELSVYPYTYGVPIKVFMGETIGHKSICNFPAVYTTKVQLIVDEPNAAVSMAAYCDSIKTNAEGK